VIIKALIKFVAVFVVLLLFLIAVGIIWLYVYPLPDDIFFSGVQQRPLQSYQDALERIDVMKRSDIAPIHPSAYTKVFLHGRKTDSVVVFLHGLTNTPRQFALLGEDLFRRGYNVIIPRFPYHGHHDPLAKDIAALSSARLISFSDSIINVATGLGETVIVVGLSMGGTLTAWLAQERSDIDTAIIIAPLLNAAIIPQQFIKPAINLLRFLPNRFMWWDPEVGPLLECPEGVYAQFSSRVIGNLMHIGWVVKEKAALDPPRVETIIFVVNAHDSAVNRDTIDELYSLWKRSRPEALEIFEFSGDHRLDHDMIDPEQFPDNIRIVYPELIRLITDRESRRDTV
jgi:pimeloyl-ACP methyl ester carboxylesterase